MRTTLALALVATLGLAACNNTPTAESTAADNAAMDNMAMDNTAMAGAATDGTMAMPGSAATTPDFVSKAAISDMFEIESAKVALARSKTPEIKAFAQMMIDDHSKTTAKVKDIVAKDNLAAPPATLDDAHAKMLADLKAASDTDFDTTYLDQQTSAHEDAVALMKAYGAGGDNADLKAFATETTPKIQGHLDKAKSLDKAGADDKNAG